MNPKMRNLNISIIFLCAVGLPAALAGCRGGDRPNVQRPTASVTVPGATSWPPVTTQAPPGTLDEPTLTPLPSASPSPSRMWPPISSGTGESICFVTPKPPEPFSRFPEEKLILQCVPIEENKAHLDRVVVLNEFLRENIYGLGASPNGQWLALTFGHGPGTRIFEMTAGQPVTCEPTSDSAWCHRFRDWGADGNTVVLSNRDEAILLNLLDRHEETENLPSVTNYGVDLAPDGRQLVYAQPGESFGSGEMCIKKRGADKPSLCLTDIQAHFLDPIWSPAGNVIAYLKNPDTSQDLTSELWVTDEKLQSPRKLSDVAGGYFGVYAASRCHEGAWKRCPLTDVTQTPTADLTPPGLARQTLWCLGRVIGLMWFSF